MNRAEPLCGAATGLIYIQFISGKVETKDGGSATMWKTAEKVVSEKDSNPTTCQRERLPTNYAHSFKWKLVSFLPSFYVSVGLCVSVFESVFLCV